jgi:thioester reductase-like protein
MIPIQAREAPAASIQEGQLIEPARYRAPQNRTRWNPQGATLLTGGTGFLGRELIPRLLAQGTEQSIYILIRGRDDMDVRHRFRALADSLSARWPNLDRKCLHPVRGDIALPRFGLDREDARDLARSVTRIVHSAASIRLNTSLAEARKTNLAGAGEVLRLAESCPRLQSLAWISTAFVAGDRRGCIREEELQCGQGFRNGYEQSKFEAELMAQSARTRLPITIFRPSIIVGDSRDGYTSNFASIYWPLRLIAAGILRRVSGDPLTPLDLVPVDYVADAVAELMEDQFAIGGCYHLVAGRFGSILVRELLDRAIRRFDRGGKPLRFLPPGAEMDARLHAFFAYLDDCKEFDDSGARAALQETGLLCPRATDYLDRLFEFCEQTKWGAQGFARPAPYSSPIARWEQESCATSV